MKKRTAKRIFVSAVCCLLCIVTVALASPLSAYAAESTKKTDSAADEEYKNQLADLQDKQKDIANRQQALNDKIKSAKSEKAQLQARINSLDEQINRTCDQMELGQNRINVTKD